jgi:segregation and condensation protein A
MAFQVKIDIFEGPFELLLNLISRQEIDIYQVNISDITNEYLLYLDNMRTLDLEIATEFLLMAATLIKLKAESLLPRPAREDLEDFQVDSLEELVWRLLEYRKFRNAAEELERRLEREERFYRREVEAEEPLREGVPDILSRISVIDLARAAEGLASIEPEVDVSHIAPIRINLRDYIARVLEKLRDTPEMSFKELTGECSAKLEVIVYFLALLELYKWDLIGLRQSRRFGDIRIMRQGEMRQEALEELMEDILGLAGDGEVTR